MSLQFDTFDTLEDRRELVVLFQRLGGDLPDAQAQQVRAAWLESLMVTSLNMPNAPLHVNPASCHPVGAYSLFIQIVGVLGVPIRVAASTLDAYVSRKGWHETRNGVER